MLLVPADVLHRRRPEAHFAEEAHAAADAGWDKALIDHDALSRPDGNPERAVRAVPAREGADVAVYGAVALWDRRTR